MLQDREGNLWVGTEGGGVSRYDGQKWTTFTVEDGLADDAVRSVLQDPEGNLWIGTWGGGVSRYDGETWRTYSTEDGLPHNNVGPMLQDRDGNLWFGTWGGGASRYDGENWRNFSTQDGLAHSNVNAIFQDREGNLWFATGSYWGRFRPGVRGLSRYDGKTFRTVTTKDGPGNNFVLSILQDRDGDLWFGTWDGGVSRYDGRSGGRLP